MTASLAAAESSRTTETNQVELHGWKLLSPLPDPVGYGGMFGGVLGGKVVVGGGSQFPDKPLWLNGGKIYSDRIFTLSSLTEKWAEHSIKLPQKMGHFAVATTADAIYLAGGIDASGCLKQALEIRADKDGFKFSPMAELPKPLGYATGAIAKNRLYVVGGLHSPTAKVATTEAWSLDLKAPKEPWRREADLPGTGIFVTAMASNGEDVFVFGGIGFNAEEKPVPSKSAFRLETKTGQWKTLPDLPGPRVGAVTPCPIVSGDRIFVIGGYAEVFPGALRDHPGFSAQTLLYNFSKQTWENGPLLPRTKVTDRDATGDAGPCPMIGAPGIPWRDHIVVVSGEVRSSVRSPAALAWPLNNGKF